MTGHKPASGWQQTVWTKRARITAYPSKDIGSSSLDSRSFVTERRLRQPRSRVLVRAWDYRQRHHARGVWYRLRRVLADPSEAYAVSAEDARQLVAEGHAPEPVGSELAPARLIVFVSAERAKQLGSARPLPVRLSAELLAADCLVLARFPHTRTRD